MWNNLPYSVFDTGTLDGFTRAVNRWLLPSVVFLSFRGAGACGVAKAIYNNLAFPTWACAAGFNDNNNSLLFIFYILKNLVSPVYHYGNLSNTSEVITAQCGN